MVKDTSGRSMPLFDATFGLHGLGLDADKRPQTARRGPKGWPDRDYAALANEYVKACKSGSRSPAVDVAKAHGMTNEALRAALLRARKKKVLTRQTTGRAGGQLTDYGKQLLKRGKGK